MFDQLSDRLTGTLQKLRGIGRLTENNIKDTLDDVRRALLDADVSLEVITPFIETIREKALGTEVTKSVSPGEAFIKVVSDEITQTLGGEQQKLNLSAEPPAVILLAGLQGSGKTTTAAKLARFMQETLNKKVMLTSCDIYRPAALEQLATVTEQVGATHFPSTTKDKPVHIVKSALKAAKSSFQDVLIIDTAGRLHVDDDLMAELKAIHAEGNPIESLLVVDSMAGQDAANVAKHFSAAIPLTGVILTKMDGDARGGAALSMRVITDCPIKFVGVGERLDALEPFHPDRVAKRILGMGDIVTLVEEAERKVNKDKAKKLETKLKKGKRLDFNDLLDQFQQMKNMGGIQSILAKMPGGAGALPKAATDMMDEGKTKRMEAIIHSMTPKERAFPAVLNGSRKQRLAKGSGTNMQEVNKLIKRLTQAQKMMKKMKGGKMANRMKQLEQMQGKMPPGMF